MARRTNYEKNGNDYYRITATIGRDADGKLIRKEFYGKGKKEAEDKRDEFLLGIKNGLNIDHQNIILGALIHTWLFEIVRISNKIKPSTFERYEGIYRNYIESSELYGVKMSEIKTLQIQRYYNKLYKNGKTSNVIVNLNKLLRYFFGYAVDEGYIIKNPCSTKKLVIPGKAEEEDGKIEVFSNTEIELLKKQLQGHRLKTLILIALGTGLRLGELLGLTWSDIDMDNHLLKVERSMKRVKIIAEDGSKEYKTITQVPKSKSSIRTVPIPSSLIPILEEHKTKQKLEKLEAGPSYVKSDFVFTNEMGNSIDGKNINRVFKKLLEKAGISSRKFHCLRHTYATKLFEAGVPLKTVQMLLGHADISITANIYTHVLPKEKIQAAEKLNSLFA